jgi:hypothetical protein
MTAHRFATALIATAALTLIATPAAATEPAPEFVTVAWTVDNPADIWEVPQHTPVTVTGATVDFAAVQALVPCGRYYQIDGYKAGATTDALIAGGILYGPNNPAEDLAYDAPGTEDTAGTPWLYYTAPDCTDAPKCDGNFTHTIQSYRYVWDGVASVRADTVLVTVELTEAEAITAGCYVPPVIPPTLPPTPPVDECGTADTLACSGPEHAPLILAIGAVLLLGGLLPVIYVARRKDAR